MYLVCTYALALNAYVIRAITKIVGQISSFQMNVKSFQKVTKNLVNIVMRQLIMRIFKSRKIAIVSPLVMVGGQRSLW